VLLGWDLVAPLLGMAQGMIDEFIARMTGTSGPGRSADSPAIHLRLSQACAEVDAARALVRQDVREILDRAQSGQPYPALDRAQSGQPYPALDRARYRRDKAYAVQLCLQAVNRLFDVSGGHALFDSEALQRFHRDAHAAAHRDTLTMDFAGQDFGRLALAGSA
jgi:3-hydroxy-9,10-secoandrosta-1,3,5(10)-triene-9,17-dione monooxygenase